MPTPIRSYRLSDEAAAFIQQLANAYGSPDKGILAIAEILTPEVLAGYAPMDGHVTRTVDRIADDLRDGEPVVIRRETVAEPIKPKKAETVAERKQRERREHAAALADADVVARAVGRDDIDYDLENTPHRNVLSVGTQRAATAGRPHYQVEKRKVTPLTRPHGSTQAKAKRKEQG